MTAFNQTWETFVIPDSVVVVPSFGLKTADLLKAGARYKNEKRAAETIQRELRVRFEEHLDDHVQWGDPASDERTGWEYILPLKEGRMEGSIDVVDDLGVFLLEYYYPTRGKEPDLKTADLSKYLLGKGGAIFDGVYQLNNALTGGLKMGRQRTDRLYRSESVEDLAYAAVLNCLCEERDLTRESLDAKNGPMQYADGNTRTTTAELAVFSLDGLEKADASVGGFMRWLQDNHEAVSTAGEFARAAAVEYARSNQLFEMFKAGTVRATAHQVIASIGDQYLQFARVAMRELRPPVNDRMKYLVTAQQ